MAMEYASYVFARLDMVTNKVYRRLIMVRLRTKLYFVGTGCYIALAILGAFAHAIIVTSLGFVMSIFCWYMAQWMLETDELTFFQKEIK